MTTAPRGKRRPPEPDVVRITSAPVALGDDVAQRMRRYVVQMSIRVACFLGAVVLDHWTRWILVVAAVILPYTAVLVANAGRPRASDPGTGVVPLGLTAGPSEERPGGDGSRRTAA